MATEPEEEFFMTPFWGEVVGTMSPLFLEAVCVRQLI